MQSEGKTMQSEGKTMQSEGKTMSEKDLELRIKFAINSIMNGSGDGEHHKQYALDQALRALVGCPLIEHQSLDVRGNSYSYQEFGESPEYLDLLNREGFALEKQAEEYEEAHGEEYLNGDYCVWGLGIPG